MPVMRILARLACLPIRSKLSWWFVLVATVPLAADSYLSYRSAAQALSGKVLTGLVAMADGRGRQLEIYAAERERAAATLAYMPTIIEATHAFTAAFEEGGVDCPAYSAADRKFRPFLSYYGEVSGFSDTFLISARGDAVFSVMRGEDLGSNYYTGPYRRTEIAGVFDRAKTLLTTQISAFDYYAPTNEPAAFVAAPVRDEGVVIGVVVFQMTNKELYALTADYSGLGRTGETVVVARRDDKVEVLAPLRHDPHAAMRRRVTMGARTGHAMQEAVQGKKGWGLMVDYRGKKVLAAWRYLPRLRWGIVVKMDAEEALAPVAGLRSLSLAIGTLAALAAVLIALTVAQSLSAPIVELTRLTEGLSRGELSGSIAVRSGDEIGRLSAAFNRMTGQLKSSYAALEAGMRAREEAEAAARREAEFSSAVLGTLGALVVVLDTSGRIVRFNRTCEQVTGYSFGEVEGQTLWDLFLTAEEAPEVRKVWSELTAGHFPNQHENHWLTREGRRRLIAWSNTCLVDEEGKVEHVIATGVDITEQREAEENLRLDEMRLKALLELSEMAEASLQQIADFALEEAVRLTNSTIGYLAFMNEDETVLTMHSWSKTAMAQCAVTDKPIVYPVAGTGLWGEAVRQRQPVITNDYAAPDPLKKGYPEGHVPVTRHMNTPVFDGDRIVAVAGVGNKDEPYDESDVRQLQLLMNGMWRLMHRREAAEALQRAHDELEQRVIQRTAELARSNAELEQFAYIASHDLQEPLRKIAAFGDRLEAKSGSALAPESRDYLERMQSATVRMQTLINDLLAYSRVTTQAHPFALTDLGEVVSEVLSDLEVGIEETGARLEVGSLPQLEADALQMRQLFQNLIANALKFRREGVAPVITIAAEMVPGAPGSAGGTSARIVVQDNGIGFDSKYTERIFGVFQRLHSRGEYPGSGIGLAICLKIAERHGGSLTAESTPGEGATFTVTLPIRRPRAASGP